MEMFDDIGNLGYCVDVAMVIDATAGMGPIIDEVKNNAMAFYNRFYEAMEARGKNVDELRIKVITFRDYAYDGAESMNESGFFSLPEQNDAFCNYINAISAKGGGDEPESALEAMALAMRSDWTTNGARRRHIILVFTDASAVPLKESSRTASPYYPSDMPKDLAQLGDMWSGCTQEMGGMPEERFARLIVFAPNVMPWCDIMQLWNNTLVFFSKAGQGLAETDMDMAIQFLVYACF